VRHLRVTPGQVAALWDSRAVAAELDRALHRSAGVLEGLWDQLTVVGEELKVDFGRVMEILTPSQIAKFVMWVSRNGACMEMLDKL